MLLLSLCIMTTTMTSCNKDNGGSSNKKKIVGVWQLIKATYYLFDTNGALLNETFQTFPEITENRMTFFSNGQAKMPEGWYSNLSEISYQISGDTLVLNYEDEFTILELTDSTMAWEFKDKQTVFGSTMNTVTTYDFKKVN